MLKKGNMMIGMAMAMLGFGGSLFGPARMAAPKASDAPLLGRWGFRKHSPSKFRRIGWAPSRSYQTDFGYQTKAQGEAQMVAAAARRIRRANRPGYINHPSVQRTLQGV